MIQPSCLKAPVIFLSLYDCMPFRGMVVVFNSFEEAAPQKRSKRGRETFVFFTWLVSS